IGRPDPLSRPPSQQPACPSASRSLPGQRETVLSDRVPDVFQFPRACGICPDRTLSDPCSDKSALQAESAVNLFARAQLRAASPAALRSHPCRPQPRKRFHRRKPSKPLHTSTLPAPLKCPCHTCCFRKDKCMAASTIAPCSVIRETRPD